MARRPTRRELIRGALSAGAAGAAGVGAATGAAAGTGLIAAPAGAAAPAPSDAELMSGALEAERLMAFAYRRVLASGALTPGVRRVVEPFLGHELEHVSAVAAHLSALGAAAPTGPLDERAAQAAMAKHRAADSLTDLHTQEDCFKLLVDLESVAEGVYYTAMKDLRSPGLQRLSAQIMGCEAQHWTILSGLRNPGEYVKAVPWPYVFGTK